MTDEQNPNLDGTSDATAPAVDTSKGPSRDIRTEGTGAGVADKTQERVAPESFKSGDE
jgi:hypothetical protein